jgi:chlorobactene glucosyltransferase
VACVLVPWAIAEWNSWTRPFLETFATGLGRASYQLCIPIRDEAREIPRLILELAPFKARVLFLDDESEDDGPRQLTQAGFRVLKGKPLPMGWTGKNWACYQLGQVATGDILIFMDADVRMQKKALSATLDLFEDPRLGAFSVFPQQITPSWWEQCLVPWVMHWSLFGWLPLTLVGSVRSPSVVAACGQWFAWRREVYFGLGGHEAVKNQVLEDMMLARKIKEAGFKFRTLLSLGCLQARMYHGWKEIQAGFGKNMFLLVGGRWTSMALVVSILLFYIFSPLVCWLRGHGGLAIFLLLAQWRTWRLGLLPRQESRFWMHLLSGTLTGFFLV